MNIVTQMRLLTSLNVHHDGELSRGSVRVRNRQVWIQGHEDMPNILRVHKNAQHHDIPFVLYFQRISYLSIGKVYSAM